jgi:PPM family protein phosphatase
MDGPGFAARSDVGRVRTGNEDRYLARPPVFAVADGMGGHQAGEVASALAIDQLERASDGQVRTDSGAIVAAIERSNAAIREYARAHPEVAGMGTTCTVAVVSARVVDIGHVGDSRAYRFRNGDLEQLTEDHSVVAAMVRQGLLDPDEAVTDARRHIVTRALGAEDDIQVDVVSAELASGDRVLLCSDGLSGLVPRQAIAAVLASEPDPGRGADRLIYLANEAGGDDNVTVIVIDPERLGGP